MDWEKQKFFGTSLETEDFKKGRVFTVQWKPALDYFYDTGIAIGRYLEGLREGKLTGVKCRKCRRIMVPPRSFCEWCFRPVDGFVDLKDTGVVQTFSLCYITWDMKRSKDPEIPAVIAIDGASPKMGIMHLLGEVNPEQVKIEMRVKAVWKKPEERIGSITDIKYFKPVK